MILERHRPALRTLFAAGLLLACTAAGAMPMEQARQLLQRSGFTPDPAELSAMEKQEFDAAVGRIVDHAHERTQAKTPPPAWVNEADPFSASLPGRDAPLDKIKEYRQRRAQRMADLMGWWMAEMRDTDAPLTERMTLFWHGHFASILVKVNVPHLMYRQNQTFRQYSLGNYRSLLHAAAREPAMLIFLDGQNNRKTQPNENFARELLELFTLGEGHYTEKDIKEAARAFTGWQVKKPEGTFMFNEKQHDDATKSVLGQTGNFDGDQLIDLILQQPRAATFIVEKLWREFVSPKPDAAAVQRLAADFRKDWELAPLMKALLRQPVLRDPANAGTLVKSPVELVVGTVRLIDLPISDARMTALIAGAQGQTLFSPPNVKGWPGGEDWITTNTLLARQQFLRYVSGDAPDMGPSGFGSAVETEYRRFIKKQREDIQRTTSAFAEQYPPGGATLFLAVAPVQPAMDGASPQERMRDWLLDPAYQVK